MVDNVTIPKNYTASPSSHVDTPHLTVNRDATYELEETTHFEGECMDSLGTTQKDVLTLMKDPKSCSKYGLLPPQMLCLLGQILQD